MPKKKTVDSLIKTPGTIRGVLKRKGVRQLADPEGNAIPLDYIKDHLLIKDSFVRDIATLWVDIHERLRHLKLLLLEGGPAMHEYLSANDDVRSDSKGGFTEYTFSRDIKVVVGYDLRYDIDDSLMKRSADHMDEFLQKHGETDVVRVVRASFQKRDGQYDIKALNRLDKLNIADEHFQRALELKNQAITSTPTKLRTQLAIRDSEGEFRWIRLSIHDVDKEGPEEFTGDYLKRMIDPAPSGRE